MLLEEYKESWVEDFNKIKKVIEPSVLNKYISIEHVGSTSIPGLAAKPIIDIDIVFENDKDFDTIKNSLEKLGYFHNGNQGMADRDVFKRSITTNKHPVLDFIAHHLYVCPANSKQLERHILLRDYLLVHGEERVLYEKIKVSLAIEANQDRKKYAALKESKANPFIDSIIEKAKSKKQQ